MSNSIYKNKLIIFLSALAFLLIGCESSNIKNEDPEYVEKIKEQRLIKYNELIDTATSRFNADERELFAKKQLAFFEPDINYLIDAVLTVDTSAPVFKMATTTDRKPNYRIYGYLNFKVKDTLCKLTVYQNVDYMDHPEHGGYLFIPFKDNTNEFTTYGGGRYVDIEIPDSEQLILDLNTAYNPYCAYNDRWSCPLVPLSNSLDVAIFAGEKKYN